MLTDTIPQSKPVEDDSTSKLIALIPLITLIVISSGVFNLFIYYRQFGINILAFLDIAELLPLSLSDIIDILFGFCILLVITIITQRVKNKTFAANENILLQEKLSVNKNPVFYKNRILVVFCAFVMMVDVILTFSYSASLRTTMNWSLELAVYIYSIYLSLILLQWIKKAIVTVSGKFEFLFMFSLILVMNSGYAGYKKFINVKYGHAYKGTYIVFNSNKITSNASCYYIGKTKFNILFYNEISKSVDLYPVSSVTKLSLTDW